MGRHWIGLLIVALALPAGQAGEIVPVAVRDGRCSFVLPTQRPDDKYFLVIGSLARALGRYQVEVRTEATSDAAGVPVETATCDPEWSRRINEWRLYLERSRPRPSLVVPAASTPPPSERTFRLATENVAVVGRLRGVGRHGQVYVDRDESGPVEATVAEIIRAFDEVIYPAALQLIGAAADVDGDGRFTILLTPRLPAGQGGYVCRQDLERQGTGNRGDLMVLSSALRPGPHLRALLAHEYTHALVYSGAGGLADSPRGEEDWLNEGLAHLAEEVQGHGWTNLDYRVAAYLQAPESYPLVVADHFRAGLYRCAGHRGAAFLFLRHCAARHGIDLLRRLVQTPLVGTANLEVATGEPFADLFRGWSVAQILPEGPPRPEMNPTRRLAQLFDRETPARQSIGAPRFQELPLSAGQRRLELAGTSVGYLLLHSPQGASQVSIAADPAACLQVSLVRLPAGTPRLALRTVEEADGVRLEITAQDGEVMLESASWSPLRPAGRSDLHAEPARTWFSTKQLAAGETRRSMLLPVEAAGRPILFQVVGAGEAGQVVTGWCAWEPVRSAGWSPR